MKTAIEKTMRVGRATMFLVSLAVILALTFGVASQGWAGKKGNSSGPLLIDVTNTGGSFNDKVATSSRLRTGVYLVEFKRKVEDCPRLVSLGGTRISFLNPDAIEPVGGEVSSNLVFRGGSDESDSKQIVVATRDSAGNLADRSFHLAVFC